jgi:hypothetical protein
MPDGDAWAAFTAAPATTSTADPPVQARTTPGADGWEAFTAAPSTTVPTPPGASAVAPPKTGYPANLAAGVIEGSAGVLNTLADPVGNLVGKPLAIVGTAAHDFFAPYFGYDKFTPRQRNDLIGDEDTPQPGTRLVDAAGRVIGAPATADVVPGSAGEGIARKATAAATGMLSLGPGVPGLLRTAVVNPALGVSGSLAGQLAASVAPDEYKPIAELGGNVAGMMIPEAAAAGVRSVVAGPRLNTLADPVGAPILGSDGLPLKATDRQIAAAGKQLEASATDPAAVRAALDNPPAPLMPGDNPTTARLTGDPALLAEEFTASRTGTPKQQAAYKAQADAQNDARVRVLQGQAAEADPMAVPTLLQGQAADVDAAAGARLAQTRSQTAGDLAATDAAGQARISELQSGTEAARARLEAESQARLTAQQEATEQNRARLEAASQARLGGLQETAEHARARIGGDLPAGSETQVGAAVRAPLKAADAAARAKESAAWEQVDPEGKLAVDMAPIKQGAADILKDRSSLAAPMVGNEAGIFDTVGGLEDVHSFKDLSALRGRLTDAIRQERSSPSGDAQAVRRMSILLGHVHDAMESSVVGNAAADAKAVAAGTMASDQTTVARFVSARDLWHNEDANAARSSPIQFDPGSTGRDASRRPGAVPPMAGTTDASGPGPGYPGGARVVSLGAANEVTPLPGSNRKPESLIDFLISKGGVRDQGGDLGAMDAQLVHQRGAGRLVNPKGLSLDYAREAAAEAGFIRPNSTTTDLLDAVGEHLSGNHRYRISEQEIGDRWGQAQRDAISETEARYDATDRVNTAAEDAGVRLSPAEREHAADLHMQGIHPDVAVQQAASAGESAAFDRNAAANAFGSPGVPLAARQGDNNLTGTTRLEPNFDQAAADRYAAARALTAERKGGFDAAPGVKSVLQGGPTAGTFKLPDALVTASIIRTGAAGADHARVYLAKGGDPAALSDAAAFSLRRAAMRPDGTLDPRLAADWADKRESFLSVLPDARAKFGAAAAAQRAFDDASKAEAAALKASDTADARALKDATSVEAQALKARADADLKALRATTAEAAQSLKQATATAQRTVDEAVATQAQVVKARQASAIGKFLGEADPVARVWSILNDKTLGQSSARTVAQAVKSDPAAMAGLRRAAAEAIERNMIGTARGATSLEAAIQNNKFQLFMRHAEPALREIMKPEDFDALKRTAASMERDTRSAQVGVGSATGQITAGRAPGVVKQVGKTLFGMASTATIGGAIGAWIGDQVGVGSSVGAGAGTAIGVAVGKVIQASREAGLQTVADLRTEALLNPALYRLLTAKVTSGNRGSLLTGIAAQLGHASLVGGPAIGRNVGRAAIIQATEPPRNTLAH